MLDTAPVISRDKPLGVSQLSRYLKYLVAHDDVLNALSVEGEICEFSRSAAGHHYFTLKDSTSQVSCVLFRREASRQPEEIARLRKGVMVIVHGALSLYEMRGQYQISVERVTVQGAGAFAQTFERLKTRLDLEGLFAVERKRAIPARPRKIALITSPRSQAYHDVIHRLGAQYPFVSVVEVGTSVQGETAAEEIVMAIDIVNRLTDADVILLVRGGGAAEDLVAYNDERLARSIFASRTPVITGVGHEADFTIADYVADHRAATPSLAAAAAVPDVRTMVDRARAMQRESGRLVRACITDDRERWSRANQGLLRNSPETQLRVRRQRADDGMRTAERCISAHLQSKRQRLAALNAQLRSLDPLAILRRGYAVLTEVESGKVVSTVSQATHGKLMQATVADGEFSVTVGTR